MDSISKFVVAVNSVGLAQVARTNPYDSAADESLIALVTQQVLEVGPREDVQSKYYYSFDRGIAFVAQVETMSIEAWVTFYDTAAGANCLDMYDILREYDSRPLATDAAIRVLTGRTGPYSC